MGEGGQSGGPGRLYTEGSIELVAVAMLQAALHGGADAFIRRPSAARRWSPGTATVPIAAPATLPLQLR